MLNNNPVVKAMNNFDEKFMQKAFDDPSSARGFLRAYGTGTVEGLVASAFFWGGIAAVATGVAVLYNSLTAKY